MQDEMALKSLDCKWNVTQVLVIWRTPEQQRLQNRRLGTKRHVKEKMSAVISG